MELAYNTSNLICTVHTAASPRQTCQKTFRQTKIKHTSAGDSLGGGGCRSIGVAAGWRLVSCSSTRSSIVILSRKVLVPIPL